ncbi:hypothetical protein DFH07DRAFT_765669 [Mycena maculata]|uniref:Uncharacterized protein n=1 Tax=Mycena maculata TaxID=230809 RepID=A0AAD7NXM0_9AGAR|nr:hypothetical protein DFH07DRAFT_765669 [Mycena maculata]
MDEIVEPTESGQWLSAQLQCFAGKNSMFTRKAGNGTSYSKKGDTEARGTANDEEGICARGIFSKQDRRVLWGSFGSLDLDSVWNTYYEDRPKYERLMQAACRS